jgi:phospho-N-acetylmuramoyl-pentapeptide-transferase
MNDYAELLAWTGEGYEKWAWVFFIPVVILLSQLKRLI